MTKINIDNNMVQVSSVNADERRELGIRAGDTVRVWQKIQEKGKTRLQIFEGMVLATKHGGEPGATFTVRKVASGVGVEKIFPLFSPMIDKIEIVKRARVRRAKLYILRDKVAREVKRIMRRSTQVSIATKGMAELDEERKVAEAKQAEVDAAAKKVQDEADAKAAAEKKEEEDKVAAEKAETTEDATQAEEEAKTDDKPEETIKEEVTEDKKEDK